MSKTLIGMVTFGNTQFSKLTINSIKKTTESKIDFFVVIGKPGDTETEDWLIKDEIPYIKHNRNYGFPYSVNDIYDYAWKYNDYDNLILVGNDIVAYPYAIDSIIKLADTSDYVVVSSLQLDVKALVQLFPQARHHFEGPNYVIEDFSSKCWEWFKDYSPVPSIADMQLYDIQNMCLYKRKVFETIGYTDVNFYPAYYIDNDYARRIVNSKLKTCSLTNARFFHFWSRTVHQETGGSTHKYFRANRSYYKFKWGGDFGKETKKAPILIDSRYKELEQINRWIALDKR